MAENSPSKGSKSADLSHFAENSPGSPKGHDQCQQDQQNASLLGVDCAGGDSGGYSKVKGSGAAVNMSEACLETGTTSNSKTPPSAQVQGFSSSPWLFQSENPPLQSTEYSFEEPEIPTQAVKSIVDASLSSGSGDEGGSREKSKNPIFSQSENVPQNSATTTASGLLDDFKRMARATECQFEETIAKLEKDVRKAELDKHNLLTVLQQLQASLSKTASVEEKNSEQCKQIENYKQRIAGLERQIHKEREKHAKEIAGLKEELKCKAKELEDEKTKQERMIRLLKKQLEEERLRALQAEVQLWESEVERAVLKAERDDFKEKLEQLSSE